MTADVAESGVAAGDQMRAIDASPFTTPARRDLGAAPDLRWLPIDRLVVDPSYQRPVAGNGRKNVVKIAESFDWTKFSAVIVSPVEGGKYAIIDGQHRTTAARLIGVAEVPCQIVIAGPREQAAAFSAINGATTKMTGISIFAARVAAGDEEAAGIFRACEGCGVTILRYPVQASSMTPGQTIAVGAIQRIWRSHGRDTLVTTLKTIRESANGEETGVFRAPIISAVADVLHDHKEWRDAGERLIAAFDEIDLDAMLTAASIEAHRRAGVTATIIMQSHLVDALERLMTRRAAA